MRKWLAVPVVAAVALVASSCYHGDQAGPRVAVLGDSITALSASPIETTLAPDYAWNVDGQSGYTIAQSEPQLQAMLTDPQGSPQDVITELGTNDAIEYPTLGNAWQASLTAESNALASTPCVIWVNVSTYSELNLPAGTPYVASEIDVAIAKLVAQHPNFHLLDWNAWVDQGTNYSSYIVPSAFGLGIHPNVAGEQQIADLYQYALSQDCG